MRVSFVIIIGVVLSALFFMFISYPAVWASVYWLIGFSYLAALSQRSNMKAVWLNLAVIAVTVGAYESYLWITKNDLQQNGKPNKSSYEGNYLQGYFARKGQRADIVGYGPWPGFVAHSRRIVDGEVIYDVTYTIDKKGLRISPPHSKGAQCALFFGGSYTFGEGLNDSEAMPYVVGASSGGEIQTYNFGFHGYGPHQMLSYLESGLAKFLIDCNPEHIFYLALPKGHILRVIGETSWDWHGPRYELMEDGVAKFAGHFDDPEYIRPEPSKMAFYLEKSLIYLKIFGEWSKINENTKTLYSAIIKKSLAVSKEIFPGSKFHVIMMNGRDTMLAESLVNDFDSSGIVVHKVSDIIPDLLSDKEKYTIKGDGHPNALFNELLGKYISNAIKPRL